MANSPARPSMSVLYIKHIELNFFRICIHKAQQIKWLCILTRAALIFRKSIQDTEEEGTALTHCVTVFRSVETAILENDRSGCAISLRPCLSGKGEGSLEDSWIKSSSGTNKRRSL